LKGKEQMGVPHSSHVPRKKWGLNSADWDHAGSRSGLTAL